MKAAQDPRAMENKSRQPQAGTKRPGIEAECGGGGTQLELNYEANPSKGSMHKKIFL